MQSSQNNKTRNGLVIAVVGGIAALLPPQAALAQDSTANSVQTLEKVTVTGSAIARTDKETAAPVQVISSKEIEQSGLTTVADVVRSISADNSGTLPSSFEGAFAGGAAGVALRGLTVNSTLVLLDGRRVANYALDDDGERSFVDLNSIPLLAIDRIEVLKDGASALYGADAIAGVINIILKKEYVGKSVSAEVGGATDGGGFHKRFTGEFGTGHLHKDGYNAYVTIEYQRDESISASQRDFPLNTNDLSSIGGLNGQADQPLQGAPIGSFNGTVEPGMLLPGASASPLNVTPVLDGNGNPAPPQLLNPTPCAPGSTLAATSTGGQFCQINPVSYADIQPETQRVGVSSKFSVRVGDDATAYLRASFYDTKTRQAGNLGTGPSQINSVDGNPITQNIALPPTIPGPNGTTIANPNDPFAGNGQWAIIQYQFADIPTYNTLENQNYLMVGGLKGTFDAFGEWDYDTALTVNHTSLTTKAYGDLLTSQLLQDIDNGSYNFLHSLGANSQAVLGALAPVDSVTNTSDLDMIDFRTSRELVHLPGGPLGLALGAEYRYEAQNAPEVNPTLMNPDGTTYNEYLSTLDLHTSQTIGQRDITGFYTELDAPVLRTLDIDGAFRYDHYTDTADHGITPKIGIKWTPLKQIAIRGTFSEGFRAPTFAESGASSSTLGYTTSSATTYLPNETCAPGTGFISQHCTGTGANAVPDAYVSNTYGQGILTTGNPYISPEKSRNFTLGTVLQPAQWVSVSADYYHIKKTNLIEGYDTGSIYAAYFNDPAGYKPPPGVILQLGAADPLAPTAPVLPVLVGAPYQNANDETTQGYDVDLQMTFKPMPKMKVTSEINYTEIMSFRLDQPGQPSQQYAGTQGPYALSSGAGTPRDKASWSNTVEYDRLSVTAIFNYVDGYKEIAEDTGSTDCLYPVSLPAGCKIAPFNEVDLVGSYKIWRGLSAGLDIQNLFDSKPPLDPANYATNNYNPTYTQKGAVGRFIIGRLSYDF